MVVPLFFGWMPLPEVKTAEECVKTKLGHGDDGIWVGMSQLMRNAWNFLVSLGGKNLKHFAGGLRIKSTSTTIF